MVNKLELEIQNDIQKIKADAELAKETGLLELTRCIDNLFCLVSYVTPKDHPTYYESMLLFKILTAGWYEAIEIFLDDSKNTEDFKFRQGSPVTIEWANNVLLKRGNIAITKRYIELAKAGVYKLKKNENGFIFRSTLKNSWKEALDADYSRWFLEHNTGGNLDSEELNDLQPQMISELNKNHTIITKFPIIYTRNRILDKYFSLLAQGLCKAMVGYDTVHETSNFNGISYAKIQKNCRGDRSSCIDSRKSLLFIF